MVSFYLYFALLATHFFPHFLPPQDWEYVDPKHLSPYVQAGFVKKTQGNFRPSMNLAIEDVNVSLKEYVKAVKTIYTKDPVTKWRDLGRFTMKAGEGHLIELTTESNLGAVKMLQAIFIQESRAYILTAAAPKTEFNLFQKDFVNALRSFTLLPNLFSCLPPAQEQSFTDFFDTLGKTSQDPLNISPQTQWEQLQKKVAELPEMGLHWHFLVLKEGYSKIYPSEQLFKADP